MGFSTFVCKFVRDGLPKFCCCVAFWCKFFKTFSQCLPADRWTKSVDQIMGPLDLDDILWLLRIDDFVEGWCPKPESISLGPSTVTRNTVKDWRWLEYPKRVERNKDAKWCFFGKPKTHQDFLDCEDCQKSRDGSNLSPRKSEHILATKLGIIRILFYLHLTCFFLNSNKVCMISHPHFTKLFGQIRFQQQKIATWQGPEKMCYGITQQVDSYGKSVVFLAILFGPRHKSYSWLACGLASILSFSDIWKKSVRVIFSLFAMFLPVFGWHQILSISLLVAEVWLCIVSGIKPNQRWQWTFIESPAWFW